MQSLPHLPTNPLSPPLRTMLRLRYCALEKIHQWHRRAEEVAQGVRRMQWVVVLGLGPECQIARDGVRRAMRTEPGMNPALRPTLTQTSKDSWKL